MTHTELYSITEEVLLHRVFIPTLPFNLNTEQKRYRLANKKLLFLLTVSL
jgi:hypothetical protein